MNEKALHRKEEKFFFNVHNFDEDYVEEVIEEEPPPPVFSEEELETAKKEAFEQGKQLGIEETKAARSQQIAKILEKISEDTSVLFEREAERKKIYEQEVIHLALVMFEKLFPVYQEKTGFEELKTAISEIVQKQTGQSAIAVHVSSDIAEGTGKFLEQLKSKNPTTKFSVSPDEELSGNACKLSWTAGGASLDPEKQAEQIKVLLEQMLAGNAAKGHDDKEPEEEAPEIMEKSDE